MADFERKFLNTKQASKLLGLGKSTLDKMRLNGEGPAFAKVGARVIYSIDDLETWLSEKRQNNTSQNPV